MAARRCIPSVSRRTAPLKPLSLPIVLLRAFTQRRRPARQGRFHCPSVKMGPLLRPGVSSIDRGHSHTRASRDRPVLRSREQVSATTRSLGALSLTAPMQELSRLLGYRDLDSRPRASSRSAIFSRDADTRFSESGCRLSTSATINSTHGHALEHPIPVSTQPPRAAYVHELTLSLSLVPLRIFRAQRPSPFEEGSQEPRAATALPAPTLDVYKHRREALIRKIVGQPKHRLRAVPQSGHRLRR